MDKNFRVMIVDDDPHINELLQLYYTADGFDTLCCENGEVALERIDEYNPHFVVLDLMLPGMDGFGVLRNLRRNHDVPVLILTARGDTFDKVVGLELGADDYVEKPFEPKELIARTRAILRRTTLEPRTKELPPTFKNDSNMVGYANLVVDKNKFIVRVDDNNVELPPKEMELLFFLVSNPNRVFNREQILENIWGFNFYGETRTIDVHIKRIREKLDQYPHPKWQIKTVWGVGYKFETFER